MNLIFKDDEILFQEMQEFWNTVTDAIYKDHYQLASLNARYNAMSWRKFLAHPAVQDWMNEETIALQQAKYRALLKDLDGNSRSTGLPQVMNALQAAISKNDTTQSGPIFIYSYVPLNEEEMHAPNVRTESRNALEDITEL